MDLSVRSTLPEVMDDATLDPAIYRRCIQDLAKLNRITFTHSSVLRWIDQAVRLKSEFSILDIAFGHGDLLRAIAKKLQPKGKNMRLCGIDLNPRSAAAARAATAPEMPVDYLTGDVFDYHPSEKFDFIVSSQFTHHLPDNDIIRLLLWCENHSKCGWYITDLHRHAFPYYGFRLLARLMFWHPIVRYDGTISIARSFRRTDWKAMLVSAGIEAKISWKFPFRYSVSRLKA